MSSASNLTVYELSISYKAELQAQSMSNAGNNGTNRLHARRQLLADGVETDAFSGSSTKHHHAYLLAQFMRAGGVPLCAACREGDNRRIAAMIDKPNFKGLSMMTVLNQCGICDTHGFMIPAKNAKSDGNDGSTEARQKLSKDSLLDFSYALALPDHFGETPQLGTRTGNSAGEGQMLFTIPSRSGQYARCVRYLAAGVGVDTYNWSLLVSDDRQRLLRHQAILKTLRDTLLSPEGALTATMLPHLTGLEGVIIVQTEVGRAPIYSPLQADYSQILASLADDTRLVFPFTSITEFNQLMQELIKTSLPALPPHSQL